MAGLEEAREKRGEEPDSERRMEQKRLLRAGLMERLEGRMQVDDGELQ